MSRKRLSSSCPSVHIGLTAATSRVFFFFSLKAWHRHNVIVTESQWLLITITDRPEVKARAFPSLPDESFWNSFPKSLTLVLWAAPGEKECDAYSCKWARWPVFLCQSSWNPVIWLALPLIYSGRHLLQRWARLLLLAEPAKWNPTVLAGWS